MELQCRAVLDGLTCTKTAERVEKVRVVDDRLIDIEKMNLTVRTLDNGIRSYAGIVTDGDLRRYLTSGKTATIIDDVMNRTPLTASPDQLAADVLRIMNERKITQIFVLDGGKPAGIIHMHDLLKSGLA